MAILSIANPVWDLDIMDTSIKFSADLPTS